MAPGRARDEAKERQWRRRIETRRDSKDLLSQAEVTHGRENR